MSENYEEAYRQADYFGADASPLLSRYAELLKPGLSVLDIGIGQGRNALPLARSGCRVVGIDPSTVATDTVAELATAEDLPLVAHRTGFDEYRPDFSFDVVLCFGLMQMQDESGVKRLVATCGRFLKPGGVLFLTAWHRGDPKIERMSGEWDEVAPGCFRSPADPSVHRFFLEPHQICDLFPGWQALHHWEGMGPWHRHAGGPEEQHGNVEWIARSPQ